MYDWEEAVKYAAIKFCRTTYLHVGFCHTWPRYDRSITGTWPISTGITVTIIDTNMWFGRKYRGPGKIYIMPWVGYVLDDIFPAGLNNLILLLLELEPNDITRPWESRLRATEDITDRWHDVDYTQFWNTNTRVFDFVTRFPFVMLMSTLGTCLCTPGILMDLLTKCPPKWLVTREYF